MDTADLGPSLKLKEFLRLEGMGRSSFYKIPEHIRPRVFTVPGTSVRIITSAERAAYHARLAAYQENIASNLEAERRARSEHFSALGRRAAQSPRHPCRNPKNKKRRSA